MLYANIDIPDQECSQPWACEVQLSSLYPPVILGLRHQDTCEGPRDSLGTARGPTEETTGGMEAPCHLPTFRLPAASVSHSQVGTCMGTSPQTSIPKQTTAQFTSPACLSARARGPEHVTYASFQPGSVRGPGDRGGEGRREERWGVLRVQ